MSVTVIMNHFPKIIANLAKAQHDVALEVGQAIAETAKATAPEDTGDLRRSIKVDGSGGGVTVQANARYAAYVEYGTLEHGGPQPYLTPAAHQHEPELVEKMRAAVELF